MDAARLRFTERHADGACDPRGAEPRLSVGGRHSDSGFLDEPDEPPARRYNQGETIMSEHASAAPADPYAVETRTPEPETELSVLRQTRDATRFIAVCVGVF